MTRNLRLWVATALATCVIVVVAGRLIWVHADTGQWALSFSEAGAPSRIDFDGRAYDRGDRVSLPDAAIPSGGTPGGGTIYRASEDEGLHEVTIIYVSDGHDAWAYGLVGGP